MTHAATTTTSAIHEGNILLNPTVAAQLTARGLQLASTRVMGHDFPSLPYHVNSVRLLEAFGVNLPTPLMLDATHRDAFNYTGPFKPYAHQRVTSDFMARNPRCIVLNSPGCVDSETEYLSPTGWVKISEYAGGKVAQCDPYDGYKATFVDPIQYVKLPCADMIRIVSERGVDQLLSPEHRVLAEFNYGEPIRVVTAFDVLTKHQTRSEGFKGTFPTTFVVGQDGVDMTDAELRLHVAVSADGHIPNENTRKVCMRLRRSRKLQRIQELLKDAGVPYTVAPCLPAGFSMVKFQSKVLKGFEQLWGCSQHQLRVVADEFVHWDGCHKKGAASQFFTSKKAEADFVQYAYVATGRPASLLEYDRRAHKTSCKSAEYVVHARKAGRSLGSTRPINDNGKTRGVWFEASTDGFKYCFEVPTTFLVFRRNGCVFVSGNTGKTSSTIWAAEHLMKMGYVKKVLVICPKSCVEDVWANEIFKISPWRRTLALTGPNKNRIERLHDRADYLVTNHDAAKNMQEALSDPKLGVDLVVVDESTNFKTESAARTKGLKKIIQDKKYWFLTGTPTSQSPVDAYVACKLLNPAAPQSLGAFTNMTMVKVSQFKWVPRKNSHMVVAKYLTPAIRFDKEDCLDLPPITYIDRKVSMTSAQLKAIADLKKEWVHDTKTLSAAGKVSNQRVIAVNAAARLGKILQVCQGVVIGETGVVSIPALPRLQACIDIIDESGGVGELKGKTIIFASFKASVEYLKTELGKIFPVETVTGDTSASDRARIFADFARTGDVRVLIAHPATVAHGLTITAASTIIWYGPTVKREYYQQGNERISRPGQTENMRIVNMHGCREEEIIIKANHDAELSQDMLLELKKLLALDEDQQIILDNPLTPTT
jgi:SNF2-related domain/Helicase conserved C-terminal domain